MLVAASLCWAQGDLNTGDACSHISGGCPTFSHHGSSSGSSLFTCDADCQLQRQESRKEKEEEEERRRSAKADAKILRDHAKAQHLADEAFDLLKKGDCKKAAEVYDKALTLWEGPYHQQYSDPWAWDQNMGASLACFSQNFPEGSGDRYKYDKFAYDYYLEAIGNVEADPGEVKRMKWEMWKIEYNHGRRCPEPPAWNGDGRGCVGRTDMRHDAPAYVPIPVVTAQTWTPRNLYMTVPGKFSIFWKDAWLNLVAPDYLAPGKPILGEEMKTDDKTEARLTLPDGHDIVFGEGTDLKLESYAYDPNASLTTMAIEKLDGAIRLVTGKWQQFKEQQIRVKMPQVGQMHGTLAVRGTDVEIMHFLDSNGGYPDGLKGDWVVYAHSGEISFLQHDDNLPDDINNITRSLTPGTCGHPVCVLVISPDGETRITYARGDASPMTSGTDSWPMSVNYDRDYQ